LFRLNHRGLSRFERKRTHTHVARDKHGSCTGSERQEVDLSGALARSKRTRVTKFCSRNVVYPAKMNFHDFAFIERSRAKPGELDFWELLCGSSML
jgi:hypothetical protein